MTTIEDIYKLTTETDVSEFQGAVLILIQGNRKVGQEMKKTAQHTAKAAKKFVRLRRTVTMSSRALRNMAKAARLGLRGLKGITKGAARAMGVLIRLAPVVSILVAGLGLLGAGLFNALGGMEGLTEAMDGVAASGEAAGSAVADSMDDAAASTDAASAAMSAVGDDAEEAERKLAGVAGAFGAVGAGFVQRQGKLAESVALQSDAAVASAESATAALGEADKALGSSEVRVGRFGKATARLGKNWDFLRKILLRAIGKAILPLMEKLADMFEDPRFIEFVELLAEDLADAIAFVVKWIIKKAIPAILKFMKQVKKAGGPVEYFKKKLRELRDTATKVFAIMVGKCLEASNNIRGIFHSMGTMIRILWEGLKAFFTDAWAFIASGGETAFLGLETPMRAVVAIIKGVLNTLIGGFENGLNIIINGINALIDAYNRIVGPLKLPTLDQLGPVDLPRLRRGGIALRPTVAVVGDAASPEVIAPLEDLVPMLRAALGQVGGGLTINVTVPSGIQDPRGFGKAVGRGVDSELTNLRRAGIRLPVRG